MGEMDVLKLILFLIGFCALLFLTYVTTRYIGGKQNKAMRGKHISIVETVSFGVDKRLHLVKAGTEYVLIASTPKKIDFLTTVNLDDPASGQEAIPQESGGPFDFKVLFEKYVSTYKKKKETVGGMSEKETARDMAENRDFKFNLGRLRTIVQKNEFQDKKDGVDSTNEK